MKEKLGNFPQHSVLEKPWTYRIARMAFVSGDPGNGELDLILNNGSREVTLHFSGVHSLKVESGFPWSSPGIQILDASSSGMEKARVRVCNFNFEQDPGLHFWAADVQLVKWACPCCGYRALDENPPGTDLICKICYWEDDAVQFNDPSCRGGANAISLLEARANFESFGASEKRFLGKVRSVIPSDERDPKWKALGGA